MTPEERASLIGLPTIDLSYLPIVRQHIANAIRAAQERTAKDMREKCAAYAGVWTRNLVNAMPGPLADSVSEEIAAAIRALPVEDV